MWGRVSSGGLAGKTIRVNVTGIRKQFLVESNQMDLGQVYNVR
jgi:hypothetical protein